MSIPAASPSNTAAEIGASVAAASASSVRTIRWGISSCGKISADFVNAIRHLPDIEIVACAARSEDEAAAFARKFNIKRSYGGYAQLAADAEVDVVYIGSLHPAHAQHATLYLEANKHILVEKPFAVTARDAGAVFALARARNLFCMEAMWTRFCPSHVRMRELLAEGAIGEPKMVHASFGFKFPTDTPRLWMNVHAGGSALDVGVYSTALAVNVFSKGGVELPTKISAVGDLSIGEKVDVQLAYSLQYGPGRTAVLSNSMIANLDTEARISGTKGWIKLGPSFHCAQELTIQREGDAEPTVISFKQPRSSDQFEFNFPDSQLMVHECIEVNKCLRAGKIVSDLHTPQDTLQVLGILDEVRRQVGVVYAEDRIAGTA